MKLAVHLQSGFWSEVAVNTVQELVDSAAQYIVLDWQHVQEQVWLCRAQDPLEC